ncbi:PTS sugar transporter subunit IIA [Aquisphaera insulae]|uniref:PTS sugar transporter subunit IIA n=1 Tax=Aquisphaera insulae TaxID=2712864 RepID=UPI0013EC0DA2|nr:PTS sugar transporter subunit IIA [Aquisphaera insulae]
MIRLADSIQSILFLDELGIEDRDSAFRAMVEDLARGGHVPAALAPDLSRALVDRAELGPTAIGDGVAIPHAWHRGLDRTVAALGLSQQGLAYESLDGGPVHFVLLILSPADPSGDAAKKDLFDAWLGRLQDPAFRTVLLCVDFPEGLREFLESVEV